MDISFEQALKRRPAPPDVVYGVLADGTTAFNLQRFTSHPINNWERRLFR
jgi:hypothetical protein